MIDLITQNTRQRDLDLWKNPCQEQLHHQAILGIEAFNQAEFFLAHELLEKAWNEDQSPGRDLYQAILQISVAYLQIQRRNFRGAVKMFFRVRKLIDFFPAECKGVDVLDLRKTAQQVYDQLILLGPEKIQHFNQSLFRPIRIIQKR
jgi:predicted metal-dependent hydrolase